MNLLDRRQFLALSSAVAVSPLLGTQAWAQTVSGLFDDIPIEDEVMGDLNAKVAIIEYASMTCPHCKSFHERVLPTIKEKYIDTGKAKYILRPFPFDGDRLHVGQMRAKQRLLPNDRRPVFNSGRVGR